MSIQSNINQALGVGAVLATQTGAYKHQQEVAGTKKELRDISKAHKQEMNISQIDPTRQPSATRVQNMYNRVTDIARQHPTVTIAELPAMTSQLKADAANLRARQQAQEKSIIQSNYNIWGRL